MVEGGPPQTLSPASIPLPHAFGAVPFPASGEDPGKEQTQNTSLAM